MKSILKTIIYLAIIFAAIHFFTGGAEAAVQPDTIPALSEISDFSYEIVYNDVKDAIKALADGMGTTVEYVWPILIKQQLVYSITCVSIYFIIFPILIFLLYHTFKISNKDKYWLHSTTAIVFVFSVIILAVTIYDTITGFVNPEYGAIKEVINLIK